MLHEFGIVRFFVRLSVCYLIHGEKPVVYVLVWGEYTQDVTRFEAVAHFHGRNAVRVVENDRSEDIFFLGLSLVNTYRVEVVSVKIRVGVGAVCNRFESCFERVYVVDTSRGQIFVDCLAIGARHRSDVKFTLHASFHFE